MHRIISTFLLTAALASAPVASAATTDTSDIFNDASCVPAADKTTPVLYVHGTAGNTENWAQNAVALKAAGYCVWGFNYGRGSGLPSLFPGSYGNADINSSARELARNVERVKEATGAEQVDLVAHSQGGLLVKKYIAELGGGDNVRRAVTVGATFHGTDLNGAGRFLSPIARALPRLAAFLVGPGALQQLNDSPEIQALNALPDTQAGIVYTSLYSPSDVTATPNSTSILQAVDGADVVNINIEASCPNSGRVLHPNMQSDLTVAALTRWGLERTADDRTPNQRACSLSALPDGSDAAR